MSNFRKFFNKSKPTVVSEYYATIIDQSTTSTTDHNYFGWKLYFKEDLNTSNVNKLLKHVQVMKEYIKSNVDSFNFDKIREKLCFIISFKQLIDDVQVKDLWPTFANDLAEDCKECLASIGLAMHQTIIEDIQKLSDNNYVYENDLPMINVRLLDYAPLTKLQDLKVEDYNRLVTVFGTVIRASYKSLKCTMMVFKCPQCEGLQVVKQNNYKFTPPRKCLHTGCKKSSNFTPLLSSVYTKTVEHQNIKIQDLFGDEKLKNGTGASNSIDCCLTKDLVNCCTPGDDILITGVLKIKDNEENATSGTFSMYIEALSLVNHKDKTESIALFTQQDYYDIRDIHEQEDILRLFVHSLCPYIYGQEIVKAGLLLTMFGGNSNSHQRSNPHILIVGDPGLGKSQMLKASADVAPRGLYVCGTTSTNTGLTVSVTKENGEYSLDAGVLLLSDTGTCCIDEFDKMSLSQQDSLLEVMEQQSISLAKAGIVCTLSAKTKVIAAANPIKGHYDRSKTIQENLHISQAMLSRFDLIFLLLDQPDEQHDSFLSDHIISLRTGKKKLNSSRSTYSCFTSTASSSTSRENNLKERLKLTQDETIVNLTPSLLKKYIMYAQKHVNPILTPEAKDVLKSFYLKLRADCKKGDSIPITTRILESMKRLTEARAKLELREEATKDDALEVIEIIKASNTIITSNLLQLETKTINKTSFKKKQIDKVLDTLNGKSKLKGNTIFSLQELREICNEFGVDSTNTVEMLNIKGFLLMKGNNNYQFIRT